MMRAHSLTCPCCNQAVATPTINVLIDQCDLEPREANVLRAVWNGRGLPVMPTRIFNIMYEDDFDGGPSQSVMYRRLREALSRLRVKLKGSGVSVESAGYRRGYRLVIGEK